MPQLAESLAHIMHSKMSEFNEVIVLGSFQYLNRNVKNDVDKHKAFPMLREMESQLSFKRPGVIKVFDTLGKRISQG